MANQTLDPNATAEASACLHLSTPLTIEEVGATHAQLRAALAQRHGGALTLNLAEVADIDGAGLQLLLALSRAAEASGTTIALRQVPETIAHTLTRFGVAGRFSWEVPA